MTTHVCIEWLTIISLHTGRVPSATHCNTLQHTATHCNTLQHNCLFTHGTSTHQEQRQPVIFHRRLSLFLMGTVALYMVCSTGLRQTQGSPSFCLFRLIGVFCVFLFSTPASHSPLVLFWTSCTSSPARWECLQSQPSVKTLRDVCISP